MICDKCGKAFPGAVPPIYCSCGIVTSTTKPSAKPSSAWVRWVKLLKKPEDKGVGDTVQRIAAKFGGERFKAFAAKIGMPCGCTERQAAWNELWPY